LRLYAVIFIAEDSGKICLIFPLPFAYAPSMSEFIADDDIGVVGRVTAAL
jgi:hypothetical protein